MNQNTEIESKIIHLIDLLNNKDFDKVVSDSNLLLKIHPDLAVLYNLLGIRSLNFCLSPLQVQIMNLTLFPFKSKCYIYSKQKKD